MPPRKFPTLLCKTDLRIELRAIQQKYFEKWTAETRKVYYDYADEIKRGSHYLPYASEAVMTIGILEVFDIDNMYVMEIYRLHQYLEMLHANLECPKFFLKEFQGWSTRRMQSLLKLFLPMNISEYSGHQVVDMLSFLEHVFSHGVISDEHVSFIEKNLDYSAHRDKLAILSSYFDAAQVEIFFRHLATADNIRDPILKGKVTQYLSKWLIDLDKIFPVKNRLIQNGIPIFPNSIFENLFDTPGITRSHFVPAAYMEQLSKKAMKHFVLSNNRRQTFSFASTTTNTYCQRFLYGRISAIPRKSSLEVMFQGVENKTPQFLEKIRNNLQTTKDIKIFALWLYMRTPAFAGEVHKALLHDLDLYKNQKLEQSLFNNLSAGSIQKATNKIIRLVLRYLTRILVKVVHGGGLDIKTHTYLARRVKYCKLPLRLLLLFEKNIFSFLMDDSVNYSTASMRPMNKYPRYFVKVMNRDASVEGHFQESMFKLLFSGWSFKMCLFMPIGNDRAVIISANSKTVNAVKKEISNNSVDRIYSEFVVYEADTEITDNKKRKTLRKDQPSEIQRYALKSYLP